MKNLDLNNYGVQEMGAKEMEEANGGWKLFGSERSQEMCWTDGHCCGVKYYQRKYFLGICYSEGWQTDVAACND